MHDLAMIAAQEWARANPPGGEDPVKFGHQVALAYCACQKTQYNAGDKKATAAALASLSSAFSPDGELASGADPCIAPSRGQPEELTVEHHLDPLVQARLAEVVHRLRRAWIDGPALQWGLIYPIRELARADFDKRIAGALVQGFFQFSQFLAGFEVLVLELEHRGVVREQSVLGLEKLLVDGGYLLGDQIEISNTKRDLPDLFCCSKCGRND